MEPRRHHFVPQCWLAGFTDTGTKDGSIFVTDFKRKKQWKTTPGGCGHIRDYYRIPGPDPVMVETTLSKIEDVAAPVFRRMFDEQRGPYAGEWENLFEHIAVQYSRVPAFRPYVLGLTDSIYRKTIKDALASPDSWTAFCRSIGIPEADHQPGYEAAKTFVEKPEAFTFDADNDWYVLRAFEAAEKVVDLLAERYWGERVSPSGSFVGCDNPVILDGEAGKIVGFKNAEIIVFPATRHTMLYGTTVRVQPPFLNRYFIAYQNTLTMLNAHEQVFSHVPDFCWMDSAGKYQTDWTLFPQDEKLQSRRTSSRIWTTR